MSELHDLRVLLGKGEVPSNASITHDEAVAWSIDLASSISRELVGAGLAISLSSGDLALRSTFFCHVLASRLRPHVHVLLSGEHVSDADREYCDVCMALPRNELDLDALESRRKSFLTQFYGPAEYGFVLERQRSEDIAAAGDSDKDRVRAIFGAIDALNPTATANDLERALGSVFRSNRVERRAVIELLVMASVLVPAKERRPFHPRRDWSDDATSWRGEDGWSLDAALAYFPWLKKGRDSAR